VVLVTVLPQEALKRQVLSECGIVPTDLAFFLSAPHNWSSNDHKVPKRGKKEAMFIN
jgi:hypothetical protein